MSQMSRCRNCGGFLFVGHVCPVDAAQAARDAARDQLPREELSEFELSRLNAQRNNKKVTPAEVLRLALHDLSTGERQRGVNCCIFRNEGAGKSSDLIRSADKLAFARWPGERHYTYVDPRRVRSTNPGYCFLAAGWQKCGTTKGGLLVFELLPSEGS